MEQTTEHPLERARARLGMKPGEFAKALNVNRQHLAEVRAGRRTFSIKMAVRLEELTGDAGYVEEAARRLRTGARS